jgi:hypothetical protein
VVEAPVLTQPNFEEPFIVDTDASAYAIGAVLHQRDESGHLRPIAYLSKTLDETQRNWDIGDRELYAVMEALRAWKPYLAGAKHQVTIRTDHRNLQYFKKPQKLNRRQARWNQELADYDFVLQHITGAKNVPTDFLSRPPGDKGEHDNEDVTMLGPGRLAKMEERKPFPQGLRKRRAILQRYHDHELAGHPGVKNTLHLIKQHYQ